MVRYLVLLVAVAALLPAAPANAARVRVRGNASIEARAVLHGGYLEVQGRLDDDAGRAVVASHIRLRLLDGPAGRALRLPEPEPCAPTGQDQLHAARGDPNQPDEYVVDTDGAGAFCVRLPDMHPPLASAALLVELAFEGNDYYPPVAAAVSVVAERRATVLAFSPEPRRLALERPAHTLWVEARVEPPLSGGQDRDRLELELSFTGQGEQPRVLASAPARPGERAQLEITSADLGPPGPGVLSVRSTGSEALQPGERSAVVLRTARVALGASGTITPGNPEGGIEIPVAVGSALGAVPSGSVEARLGAASVGMAPVHAGAATILVRFDAPRDELVELELVYVSREPWWIAGDALVVRVPIAAPSPWRSLPWMLAAVAILLWFASAWRRPARRERAATDDDARAPSGRPSLEVVELGPANSGWRGHVLDAHDGEPIQDARVQVVVPAFQGDGVVAEATTDEAGSFDLPHAPEATATGVQLRIKARWHAALARPMPPAGFVAVQLVSRRRALLERLVDWARRRGSPWANGDEPTPGDLATVARDQREPAIAEWAQEVEAAAYGPEPPDEPREAAIRERESRLGK